MSPHMTETEALLTLRTLLSELGVPAQIARDAHGALLTCTTGGFGHAVRYEPGLLGRRYQYQVENGPSFHSVRECAESLACFGEEG